MMTDVDTTYKCISYFIAILYNSDRQKSVVLWNQWAKCVFMKKSDFFTCHAGAAYIASYRCLL